MWTYDDMSPEEIRDIIASDEWNSNIIIPGVTPELSRSAWCRCAFILASNERPNLFKIPSNYAGREEPYLRNMDPVDWRPFLCDQDIVESQQISLDEDDEYIPSEPSSLDTESFETKSTSYADSDESASNDNDHMRGEVESMEDIVKEPELEDLLFGDDEDEFPDDSDMKFADMVIHANMEHLPQINGVKYVVSVCNEEFYTSAVESIEQFLRIPNIKNSLRFGDIVVPKNTYRGDGVCYVCIEESLEFEFDCPPRQQQNISKLCVIPGKVVDPGYGMAPSHFAPPTFPLSYYASVGYYCSGIMCSRIGAIPLALYFP